MSTRIITLVLGEGGYNSIVEGERFISALCPDELLAAVCHLLVSGEVPYSGLMTERERIALCLAGPHKNVHDYDIHPLNHGGQHARANDPAQAQARLEQLNPQEAAEAAKE